MNDLIVRQQVNGLAVTLGICMFVITVMYIYRTWQTKDEWYRFPGVRGAISIAVFVAGEILLRGWVWFSLYREDESFAKNVTLSEPTVAILGCVLLSVGALCFVRVFSPPHWQPWGWVGSGLFSMTILVIVYLM